MLATTWTFWQTEIHFSHKAAQQQCDVRSNASSPWLLCEMGDGGMDAGDASKRWAGFGSQKHYRTCGPPRLTVRWPPPKDQRSTPVMQILLASTLFVNGKDNHLLPCLLTGVILRIKNKPVNINMLWELPGLMQRLVLTMCRGEARAKGAHCLRLYSERTTRCLDNLTGCSYPKMSGCSPDSLFEGK